MSCTSSQVSASSSGEAAPQAGMPVSLMPFSMIQKSSPSLSSWVAGAVMSGARG